MGGHCHYRIYLLSACYCLVSTEMEISPQKSMKVLESLKDDTPQITSNGFTYSFTVLPIFLQFDGAMITGSLLVDTLD